MMFIRKSTHDRAMAVHAMTENRLLERIARLELQLKNAAETASLKSRTILALEEDLAEQSTKITTLSNLNAALKRKYEPVRGPGGKWISKAVSVASAQVSA